MEKDNDMFHVGDVDNLPYWCEPKEIFDYLDTVSPVAGSKFKCPVCAGSNWGCSTIGVKTPSDTEPRDVLAPAPLPLKLPDGSNFRMDNKVYQNFHYMIVCITCANTIFLNAAMVHSKIKVMKSLKHD